MPGNQIQAHLIITVAEQVEHSDTSHPLYNTIQYETIQESDVNGFFQQNHTSSLALIL